MFCLSKYVDEETLLNNGFNYDSPSLICKCNGKDVQFYISEPRGEKQKILACVGRGNKYKLYLRTVDDMSETDGVGLNLSRFEFVKKSLFCDKFKVKAENLESILNKN